MLTTPSRALPPRIWSRAGLMARSSLEEAGSLAIVHEPRLLRSERTPSFRFAPKRQIVQWHLVEPPPYTDRHIFLASAIRQPGSMRPAAEGSWGKARF